MKKISILLCTLLLLCGCSKNELADDISCSDAGKELCEGLEDGQEYLSFDSQHRDAYFDNTDGYDDFYHVYSADTANINEIGIFHAPDAAHADELEDTLGDYIEDMRESSRAFIASYAPNELPKLDGASVRRFGNYVVYTVLPTEDAERLFDGLEARLKA